MNWQAALPLVSSLRGYSRETFASDLLAAVIVTVMLIPQSLAYALLAGLPPEVGLYASILPLVVYALFGSSTTLSVGPVAVASLMTAAALGDIAQQGSSDYLTGAISLALLSGVFLLLLGLLKLGALANLLSHPVVSGFITASGILIAFSQLGHILGIRASGESLFETMQSLFTQWRDINPYSVSIGTLVVMFLVWSREGAARLLTHMGVPASTAGLSAKAAPVVGIVVTILLSWLWDLQQHGVAVVGAVPAGLPQLVFPQVHLATLEALVFPAIMISIIGYVEAVSVGKTLAAKRRQKLDVNQELIGLGAANIASAVSGAFPVTAGFSRSVVNFDAGAATQLASIFTALGIALASLVLTPLLYYLPKATLAATIVVAVLSLIDFTILGKTWRYAKSDFAAVAVTIFVTLIFGVETGVVWGVGTSIALHLYRTSTPHIAEIGLVPGSEHFRNVNRHKVMTLPGVLMLRMDESLFFANAHHLENRIYSGVFQRTGVAHVILLCSAINEIDTSALDVLESINRELQEQGVLLHFAEIKGPVMDALKRSGFLAHVSGCVYLSQYEAFRGVQAMLAADNQV